MIIEIDVDIVKNEIMKCAHAYRDLTRVLMQSSVVLMSVDKFTDLDMTPEEKLEYMFYSDIIICMKNLGHDYSNYSYESAPLNIVYKELAFPSMDFRTFLNNTDAMRCVKNTYNTLADSIFVGKGELADLNLPTILKHTPLYDKTDLYYTLLFRISKYTSLVDGKIDMDEFVGLYAFSKYIDIDEL